MSINEMVAEEDNYGDLADDVLGEHGDEDTKEKKDAFDMFAVIVSVFTQYVVGQVAVIVFLGDHLVDGHVDV